LPPAALRAAVASPVLKNCSFYQKGDFSSFGFSFALTKAKTAFLPLLVKQLFYAKHKKVSAFVAKQPVLCPFVATLPVLCPFVATLPILCLAVVLKTTKGQSYPKNFL
jgi:hypothetical protein